MKKMAWMVLVLILVGGLSLVAEEDPAKLIDQYLYAPEVIMENREIIGLSESVGAAMRDEVLAAQKDLMEIQWELSGETHRVAELLQESLVNEVEVMAEIDRLLDVERTVKKRQLALLIRLRNLLTPRQRAQLDEIR